MIPRPKILTRVTISSGNTNNQFFLKVSKTGSLDTDVDVTLTSGNYFLSGDNQSDDLIGHLTDAVTAAVRAVGSGGGYDFTAVNVIFRINQSTHKVVICFDGFTDATNDNDVRIEWLDMDNLGRLLGFDVGSNDSSTSTENPTFTGDYQHSHAWYADEDGLLKSINPVDFRACKTLQQKSLTGVVKSQLLGSDVFYNELQLQFVSRAKMYSDNSDYSPSSTPNYPFERNEGLECWFNEAIQGIEFRVYVDGYATSTRAIDTATISSSTATAITCSAKSWDTEPQEHKGRLAYVANHAANVASSGWDQLFYISSHTATVLTVTGTGIDIDNATGGSSTVYILDNTYRTYVLNLEKMSEFMPVEVPNIDRYNIAIPLLKYVAP